MVRAFGSVVTIFYAGTWQQEQGKPRRKGSVYIPHPGIINCFRNDDRVLA
jgi:hypothetical protein